MHQLIDTASNSGNQTSTNSTALTMSRRDAVQRLSESTQADVDVALQDTVQMYNLTIATDHVTDDAINGTIMASSSAVTEGMYVFRAYLSPVIILLGIIGNLLCIGIFLRYRKWDQASIHYLFYLAVSDTGNLLFNGVVEWFHIGLKYATNGNFWIDIAAMNLWTCVFVRYIWLHCAFISSWILVFFTVERFLVVWFPLRAVKWVTVGRRRWMLSMLTGFSLIAYFPIPFIYDVYKKHGFSVCLPNSNKSPWMSSYFSFHSMVTTYFLPCLLLALFNVVIIIGIAKASKGRQEISAGRKTKKRDVMIAVNLLVVSSVYLILTIPFCLAWGVWFYWESIKFEGKTLEEIRDALEANRFITSISIINYSVNFFIYTARLPFFKRRVLTLIRCRQYNQLDSTNSKNGLNDSAGKRKNAAEAKLGSDQVV